MVAGVCKNFSRNAVRPGCFVVIGKLHSALNFIEGGKLLKSGMMGNCGVSSAKMESIGLMQLRSSLKYVFSPARQNLLLLFDQRNIVFSLQWVDGVWCV